MLPTCEQAMITTATHWTTEAFGQRDSFSKSAQCLTVPNCAWNASKDKPGLAEAAC